MKRILIVACAAALLAATFPAAPAAAAEPYKLTFSTTVRIPGAILPAGTYLFIPLGTRVIQVLDADHTTVYSTFLTVPRYRLESTPQNVVVFEEVATAMAPPLKIWFPPYNLSGFEFVYKTAAAEQLAQLALK
jgi:hypothetical protein